MNVAVLGASDKPDRYSYKAVKKLIDCGHRPFPVHPRVRRIDDIDVWPSLSMIKEPIDTITMYLSSRRSSLIADEIIGARARRVIFNPGAENEELAKKLAETGTEVVEACTLVMLATGQF